MSQGEDPTLAAFREKASKEVLKHLKSAAQLAAGRPGCEELADLLNDSRKRLKKEGVHAVAWLFEAIADGNAAQQMPNDVYARLAQAAQAVFQLAPNQNAQDRFGGEVALTDRDLQ